MATDQLKPLYVAKNMKELNSQCKTKQLKDTTPRLLVQTQNADR